jgi:hypothetical protein
MEEEYKEVVHMLVQYYMVELYHMVVVDYSQVVHKEEHYMEVGYMAEDYYNQVEDMEVEHYKAVEDNLVEVHIQFHYILD